jgi:methanogenic corrinoid protein MtbC1
MKLVSPTAKHTACRDAMINAIRNEAADMDAAEILAIAAYTVGQLIALQDQRKMTPAQAMDIVAKNIEAGNAWAMQEVLSAKGMSQ